MDQSVSSNAGLRIETHETPVALFRKEYTKHGDFLLFFPHHQVYVVGTINHCFLKTHYALIKLEPFFLRWIFPMKKVREFLFTIRDDKFFPYKITYTYSNVAFDFGTRVRTISLDSAQWQNWRNITRPQRTLARPAFSI